jgi:hypothetical protein
MASLPYKGRTVQRIAIAQGAAGSTDILAAVANQRIYLVGAYIDLDAGGSLKFQTNGTDITGAIPIAANGGFVLPLDVDNPWLYTKIGDKLNIFTATGKAFGWALVMTGLHSTPDA